MLKDDLEAIAATCRSHGYELGEAIGSGGFGTCYLVTSSMYKMPFVMKKTVLDTKAESEIKVLSKMCHPNIVSIYDYFSDEKYSYLIMEYCSEGNLEQYIEKNGQVPLELLRKFSRQLLDALIYCHKHKVVHKDIKPANVLIDSMLNVKLADFGLSLTWDANAKSTSFCGSYLYNSPEALLKVPYDPYLSDIWSLGITIFQMAAGCLPWAKKAEGLFTNDVLYTAIDFTKIKNRDFRELCSKMIRIDPTQRISLSAALESSFLAQTTGPRSLMRRKSSCYSTPKKSMRRSSIIAIPVFAKYKKYNTGSKDY